MLKKICDQSVTFPVVKLIIVKLTLKIAVKLLLYKSGGGSLGFKKLYNSYLPL